MVFFVVRTYFRILAACWSTFGLRKEFLWFLLFRSVSLLLDSAVFLLDNLFFPGYRRIKVEKPIFIIGHPRSGTTFFHHLLTRTGDFTVFKLWEMIIPSLTARKLLGPLVRLAIRRGKGTFLPQEAGHKTALDSVEEEEFLFLHILNTQMVTMSTPLGFGNHDYLDLVYSDRQPEKVRRKTMNFLKSCFQRQIYYTRKKQIIAKITYSGMRIQSLLEAFPDIKIVYMVRSPYESMSSHLSLYRSVIDHNWGLKNVPPDRLKRAFERRYAYDTMYYKYIEQLLDQGVLDSSRCMTIRYDRLKDELGKVVEEFLQFTGIEISDGLRAAIDEQIRKQESYRPEHKNLTLEDFGLTREKIASDLGPIFDKYGFEK